MQEAGFSGNISSTTNSNVGVQNGQVNAQSIETQQQQAQNTSIFGQQNKGGTDVNQSNTNSSGTGGLLGNIFTGGIPVQQGFDNTSIFAGMNRGSQYALYSKKDESYDVPKLTQEDIANQKAAEGPKRTNPKAYNIDMTPKANPYEAFRNPEMQEPSLAQNISKAISGIFGSNKAG